MVGLAAVTLLRDGLLEEMEDQVAAGQIIMRVQLAVLQHPVRVAMGVLVEIVLVVAEAGKMRLVRQAVLQLAARQEMALHLVFLVPRSPMLEVVAAVLMLHLEMAGLAVRVAAARAVAILLAVCPLMERQILAAAAAGMVVDLQTQLPVLAVQARS